MVDLLRKQYKKKRSWYITVCMGTVEEVNPKSKWSSRLGLNVCECEAKTENARGRYCTLFASWKHNQKRDELSIYI